MTPRRVIVLGFVLACSGAAASVATAGSTTPATIDGGTNLLGIACPATSQCTAVDFKGQALTFDPAAPAGTTRSTVDSFGGTRSVSCPSRTQCTAIDARDGQPGREVTFNPLAPGTPTPVTVDPSAGFRGFLEGVACPSTSQCTAVGLGEVTFNPTAPGAPSMTDIGGGAEFTAVACPSASQCTAVGFLPGNGTTVPSQPVEVTFNPAAPATATLAKGPTTSSLFRVACPSVSQCTAVGGNGDAVTFNPAAPGSLAPTQIDSQAAKSTSPGIAGVACPSVSQCTAVDYAGYETTFNPVAPAVPATFLLHQGAALWAIACPSAGQCTAIAGPSGHLATQVVTFNPLAPKTAGAGGGGAWSAAMCRKTYHAWLKHHKGAGRSRKQAEVRQLHKAHGCSPALK